MTDTSTLHRWIEWQAVHLRCAGDTPMDAERDRGRVREMLLHSKDPGSDRQVILAKGSY